MDRATIVLKHVLICLVVAGRDIRWKGNLIERAGRVQKTHHRVKARLVRDHDGGALSLGTLVGTHLFVAQRKRPQPLGAGD